MYSGSDGVHLLVGLLVSTIPIDEEVDAGVSGYRRPRVMLTLDLHVTGCVVHQVKAISLHAPHIFQSSRQEMSSSNPDFRWYQGLGKCWPAPRLLLLPVASQSFALLLALHLTRRSISLERSHFTLKTTSSEP
jgi:hypothetical protein